jgi:heptosyltransferase-2
VRHVGFGDLIWHLPFIRSLAARSPDGRVTVIAPASTLAERLLAREPVVDQVLEDTTFMRPCDAQRLQQRSGLAGARKTADQWRLHRFDRIYLFSDRWQHAMAAWLAGIPRRAGLGLRGEQRLLLNCAPYVRPHTGPGVTHYEEALAFALAHGLVNGRTAPRIALAPADVACGRAALAGLPRPRVALCIGASARDKQWGEARFTMLTRWLLHRGFGVVLVGGPTEAAMALRIVAQQPALHRGCVRALAQGDVLLTAGVLSAASLSIGNDTGALNLSAACGVRSVCILGPRPLLLHDPLIHCLAGPALAAIDAQQVAAQVSRWLEPAAVRP